MLFWVQGFENRFFPVQGLDFRFFWVQGFENRLFKVQGTNTDLYLTDIVFVNLTRGRAKKKILLKPLQMLF